MAVTQLRGSNQIKDATVTVEKLASVSAASWAITPDNTGTITGLTNPTVANDAVNKNYVDGLVNSVLKSPDGYATNAAGDYPSDYKSSGVASEGDTWIITSIANGTSVGTQTVNLGDMLVALIDTPGNTDGSWAIIESNRSQATETVMGMAEIATQVEADLGTDDLRLITPLKLSTYLVNAGISAGQAQNGLTMNGNFVEFGGALNRDTVFTIDTYDLSFNSTFSHSAGGTINWEWGKYAGTEIRGTDYNANSLAIDCNEALDIDVFDPNNTGTHKRMHFDAASGIVISGDAGFDGAKYDIDYSATFVTRSLVDKGYVDAAVSSATFIAGAGMTKTGQTADVIAADLSIIVNADDLAVNVGNTNGTSLVVSATGLELAGTVTGNRVFSSGSFEVSAAGNAIDLISTSTITINAGVNDAVLANQPDGTNVLSIATTKYVDDVVNASTSVISELPIVTNGSANVTLANTPANNSERIYLNGLRMAQVDDFTIAGAIITFTSPLITGDKVLADYEY